MILDNLMIACWRRVFQAVFVLSRSLLSHAPVLFSSLLASLLSNNYGRSQSYLYYVMFVYVYVFVYLYVYVYVYVYVYMYMYVYENENVYVLCVCVCVCVLSFVVLDRLWGQRLLDPSYSLFLPEFSLKKAGPEQLSTCDANDQRNRQRVVLDLLCQTSNGQDQVVTVGELLAHVRTLFLFVLYLPPSLLPSSPLSTPPSLLAISRPVCRFNTPRRFECTRCESTHFFFSVPLHTQTPQHTTHAPLLPPPTHSNTAQYTTQHKTTTTNSTQQQHNNNTNTQRTTNDDQQHTKKGKERKRMRMRMRKRKEKKEKRKETE